MMNSRWQANKIGLINFWYYDEQEFPFVKGRMLLRGSNGSGKSVTMQSVVPHSSGWKYESGTTRSIWLKRSKDE